MSNATAQNLIATAAAAVVDHDGYVAFWSSNITEFARQIIPASVLADFDADPSDYLVQSMVASDVAFLTRLDALTDAELAAEYAENQASHLRMIDGDDPSEYDVNDYESYYYVQWVIEELRSFRDVRTRYMSAPQALTHSPFAGLAVAA